MFIDEITVLLAVSGHEVRDAAIRQPCVVPAWIRGFLHGVDLGELHLVVRLVFGEERCLRSDAGGERAGNIWHGVLLFGLCSKDCTEDGEVDSRPRTGQASTIRLGCYARCDLVKARMDEVKS